MSKSELIKFKKLARAKAKTSSMIESKLKLILSKGKTSKSIYDSPQ